MIPAPLSQGVMTIWQFFCSRINDFSASVSSFVIFECGLLNFEPKMLLFTAVKNVLTSLLPLGGSVVFSFLNNFGFFGSKFSSCRPAHHSFQRKDLSNLLNSVIYSFTMLITFSLYKIHFMLLFYFFWFYTLRSSQFIKSNRSCKEVFHFSTRQCKNSINRGGSQKHFAKTGRLARSQIGL